MDPTKKIPHSVHPEKKPPVVVEADIQGHSTTHAVAVAVTKVLDHDNLLREIIVRVGFPTTLVRAALVCKRWLAHASDPKFLSRFRKLHPPRLLGSYIYTESASCEHATHFVPMPPQPPELATVIRRLEGYNFGTNLIERCQNGTVFTERIPNEVHHPMCPNRHTQILPPPPAVLEQNYQDYFRVIFSKEEGSNMSYMCVVGETTEETAKLTTRVYMLQNGEWLMCTSATYLHGMSLYPVTVQFGHNKIYMPSLSGDYIIVFDLVASSYSTIQLPQGVKYRYLSCMLSPVDDASSVYLFDVMGFQLCIWLHKGDNWLLVYTICLRQMISTLGISGNAPENEGIDDLTIHQVGDNGQFVFLEMAQYVFYLDIKCMTLSKVYENIDRFFRYIHPFMMIWPPMFPALKDDPARNAM